MRLYIWKIYPKCLRLYLVRVFSSISFIFSPSIEIYPLSAPSIPPIILSNVDLPEPDGPNSTQNSPLFTSKLIPFKTSVLLESVPKLFFKSFISKNISLPHFHMNICSYVYTIILFFHCQSKKRC